MKTGMTRAGAGSIIAMILLAIGGAPVVAEADAGAASSSLIPATHLHGAVCVVSGASPSTSHPGATPPSVPAHPTSVSIVWLPGLNSTACKAVLTRGNAHIASALASEIDGARVVQNASTYQCRYDDSTSAHLYFMYPHGSADRIDAALGGCSWITAPGDASRGSTSQYRQDMSALAPKAWHSYVAPNPDTFGRGPGH